LTGDPVFQSDRGRSLRFIQPPLVGRVGHQPDQGVLDRPVKPGDEVLKRREALQPSPKYSTNKNAIFEMASRPDAR
jgi:hypothetical protein